MGKIIEIKVPQMGESITSATVAGWRLKENDNVNANSILVDLETDKVTMEIPSPTGGVLKKILKTQGTNVLIGEVLCTIEEGASVGGGGASVAPSALGGNVSGGGGAGDAVASSSAGGASAAPSALGGNVGAGSVANMLGATKNIGGEVQQNKDNNFSPSAERLIKENNLDYNKIQGTGIHNQILKSDVINHISNQNINNNINTLEKYKTHKYFKSNRKYSS